MTQHIRNREPVARIDDADADPSTGSASTQVPKRAFGNTGAKISKLCLGGSSFGPRQTDSQALIDEALKRGVDFWELTGLFGGTMYGEYFRTHPGVRPRVFLSAKTTSRNPVVMQEHLDKALADTGTSCIDFFALHTVDNVGVLTEDIREWAERAKREGKLRFFGFCTHTNMDRCLSDGADLGWIDAIQTFYNYRLRSVRSMEDALQKCHERGIGLIAVKSMALCEQTREELRKLPLNEATLQSLLAVHGMTFEQAKLRAIWQNPALTSVCSLMRSPAMLQSNALAAIDESRLPAEVDQLLSDHAESTARYFCRRCAENCEPVNADRIPICSVMQLLMMARGYEGERDFCAELFRRIPADIREKISTSDYSFAERQCPQGIPIGQLMKDAYLELSR